MIGAALLLIAVGLYFSRRFRYLSYFLYLSFMMGNAGGGGLGLWTDAVLGMKNADCAIIYTFLISVYMVLKRRWKIPRVSWRNKFVLFVGFLMASLLFSYNHYGLSPYQILQGGRSFLLVFSLPILLHATPDEVRKVLRMLLWVCLFTSVLYILQILVVGGPIMPYPGEVGIDKTTGLVRMYNFPANLSVFLALSFLCPAFMPRVISLTLIRGILFVALMCTLGRTGIATGLLTVMLALVLDGKFKKIGTAVILLGILSIPFISTISQRFEEGGTSNDLGQIMQGNFDEDYRNEGDATMLYRFAWCYERASYLTERPMGEQMFGLGMCSDSQDWAYDHYHFKTGLLNKERMRPTQLWTPDISFGNMIVQLGFLGMFIYLYFYVSLARYFWKLRHGNMLFLLMSAFSIMLMVEGFAGSGLSEVRSLSLMFLVMSLAFHAGGKGLMRFDYGKTKA